MTAARTDPYRPWRGSPDVHVQHYDLDLRYRVATNRLTARAVLTVVPLADVDEVVLELRGPRVGGVTVTGAVLARSAHRDGLLRLRLAGPAPAGEPLTVTVDYAGRPAPVRSPWGPVGWEELDDGVLVANQPTGAPSWFPCVDRPDLAATYRTAVSVEKPYRAVAHGTLTSVTARAGTTTWVYEQRVPTATYLATVQVGRYDEHRLTDGPVPQLLVTAGPRAAEARRAFAGHGAIMDHHVQVFGPYPFDAYTLVVTPDTLEIPLEAQGMGIFGANHLHARGEDARLVPHELAHQWFGNSVRVASWQHIWLNEGPACYAEWRWSQASGGDGVDALARGWHARLRRRPQDLVLSDPGYDRIFDDRVYKRGALTLHALDHLLGRAAGDALLRGWTRAQAGRAVTTDDFRAHALAAAGPGRASDVADLLHRWLDEPALPPLPAAGAGA